MDTDRVCRSTVTGVVLAGGRGLRYGGADKGLAVHRGRTLVEHQLALLGPQVAQLLVSANRNLDRYRGFGCTVVSDDPPESAGPLAGMLAAARAAPTPWLICVSCDTLGLPPDTVARLLGAAHAAGAPAAYAEAANGPQYTVCALQRSLAADLEAALAAGARTVHRFLGDRHAAAADFRDCRLLNANTPEALGGA